MPKKLTYDPKLRDAAKEIEDILKKYDICAFFGLTSETHGEFGLQVESSWSLLEHITNEDGTAHIKIKIRAKQKDKMDSMGSFVYTMRDLAAMFFQQADQMCDMIQSHCLVLHKPLEGRITNDDRTDA